MISYRYTTEITNASLRLSQPSRRRSMEPQHSAFTETHKILEFSTHCGQITDFWDVLPHKITEFFSQY
ncbi:hypothetical protein TNCV_1313521 [Trichonephila clavipes]|nr:hypothetical protein TNCV_1313521 [Trichonephila clavipes]